LVEGLVAVALMGLLLATLAVITAQWMPRWKAGFARAQSADLLGLGLDRIVADLAAAEYISPGGDNKTLVFKGDAASVTFVRSAIGPNASAGLEVVRLAETEDERGLVLVRSRAPYVPSITADMVDSGGVEFTNPVVLVRPPFRISFAFAGPDRTWQQAWSNMQELPNAVRVTVRNALTNEILPASTAALVHVNAAAESMRSSAPAPGGQPAPGGPNGEPAVPGGQPPVPGGQPTLPDGQPSLGG
jgi:general secretion pathway protein J